jgi:hypothetical protein
MMAGDGMAQDGDHPWGRLPGWPRRAARPVRAVLVLGGLTGYAWVAAAAAPFSRGALVGVLVPGAVLAVIATARPPGRIPPPEQLDVTGMSYWLICLTAFFEWEASAFRDNSLYWHPSFTNLVNPLLAPHPVKSAAIVVWMLAGWALVRR